MNSKLTIGGLAALFIACAASAQPTYASIEQPGDPKQVRVEFRRSEISNEAGARRLLERLNSASRRVCSGFDGPSVSAARNQRACKKAARAEAVQTINSPLLTAVNDGGAPMQLATK